MAKPTLLKLMKHSSTSGDEWVEDGDAGLGVRLDLRVDGKSGDTAANEQTGLLVQVFYRVAGVPYMITLFNGLATRQTSKNFTSGDISYYIPKIHKKLAIVAHAWDHKVPSKADTEVKRARVRLRVQ